MANEYLQRTPTSTGNRKVFTWAAWLKKNELATGFGRLFEVGADTSNRSYFTFRDGDELEFVHRDGGSITDQIISDFEFRDPGSFAHFMIAVNSTASTDTDRIKIYVNGVLLTGYSTSNFPVINQEFDVNSITGHYLGNSVNQAADFQGYMSDVFFVDGQALTPDVFGYYKDGAGYISVGSTLSTSFKRGQWVPKKPSAIKAAINAEGGFGVNGFYLPINDTSNMGADFHCEPNSIITLKGENNPQPRNGAPDTTDSYVSQLRSDPYASNLVLAVPGITGAPGVAYTDFSANIKGSGSNKTLTSNGNAGVAVTASYYGSALSFDGTGDYFQLTDNGDFDASGDFTIEFWANLSLNDANAWLFSKWNSGSNQREYTINVTSGGRVDFYWSTDGTTHGSLQTSAGLISANQWNHYVWEKNGSVLTGYINGVAGVAKTDLTSQYHNSSNPLYIGSLGGSQSFDGYIQDLRVYKGVAKYKSGFDVPKPYTPVGIGTWRAVPDTTANNFTTMSPLVEARPSSGSNTNHASSIITFADGNLSLTNASSSGNSQKMIAFSSVGFSTGKWYYEEITGSNGRLCLSKGVQQSIYSSGIAGAGTGIEALVRINASDGVISIANTAYYSTATPANLTAESFDTTNVMGVAVDASLGKNNLTVQFYKDGVGIATLTGIGATSPVEEWFPTKLPRSSGSADEAYFNFGQNPTFSGRVTAGTFTDSNGKGLFKYEPPTGFLALCEDNLPTPAIANPGEHFKCVLYRGDGNTGHSITGVGFQPDLVWIKERTSTSSHQLHDSIRGAGNVLISNVTNAESYSATYLYSLDSDGFTLGTSGGVNASTDDYVAWCWKAGVGTTSTNTDGAVNSVVSVNQTAGFSIIKVDGLPASTTSTFGHGLNKKPDFIIFKSRTNATNWDVYHSSLTPDGERKLYLNGTNAEIDTGFMGDTPPTSSVISFNPGSSNSNHIVYCWTEIEGFSKFGSYVGNGDTDGPFVYCGFKPAVVIQKIVTDTNNWIINDSSINSTNPSTVGLRLNTNGQEIDSASNILDFCSNGFKIRGAGSVMNTANETYIFAAFAESPFTTANAK